MRMLIGLKGDDRMFLVDLEARSVEVIDPERLDGSAEAGPDAVRDIVRARQEGIPVIRGIDLAIVAGARADEAFYPASGFVYSEAPAAGFSGASSFPFSEPPAAGFSGASSFPFSEPPSRDASRQTM